MARKNTVAAAVMVAALLSSLFALASPSGRAGALGTPGTPTDITLVAITGCTAGQPDGSVQVTIRGTDNVGNPVGSTSSPLGVQVGLDANGALPTAYPAGSQVQPPVYVAMTGSPVTVWLPGLFAAGQQLIVQADGYAPSDPQDIVVTTCATGIRADFSLAPPNVLTLSQIDCNAAGDSVTITPTISTANLDPAVLAAFTSKSGLPGLYVGLYITDSTGQLVTAPGSTALIGFAVNPDGTGSPTPLQPLPLLTLPMQPGTNSLAGYTILLVDPEGNVTQDAASLSTIVCTPLPVSPPPPPVVTDTPTVGPSSPVVTDSSSPAPSTSAATSVAPTVPEASVTPPPSDLPVVTTPPPINVEPVVSNAVTSSATSVPGNLLGSEPPSASPSSGLNFGPAPSDTPTSQPAGGASPAITAVVASGTSGIRIQQNDERALADSSSSIPKPVQILRWHSDAALVVGFDAIAICLLVGATVWSARRR